MAYSVQHFDIMENISAKAVDSSEPSLGGTLELAIAVDRVLAELAADFTRMNISMPVMHGELVGSADKILRKLETRRKDHTEAEWLAILFAEFATRLVTGQNRL